ncbi:MAG: hypothetical protein JNL18_23310 [Planctomycetaceae bacterium]|nr:hypothetical protein [Planctomycetaceae bacterium]
MELLVLGLCPIVGIGVWRLWSRLSDDAFERISPEQQSSLRSTAKNLPGIVIGWSVKIVFVVALGASVIHYAAIFSFLETFKRATEWGPRVVAMIAAYWLCDFWSSPELPTISPPRGRSLKPPAKLTKRQSAPPKKQPLAASPRRGRVIRTFRENVR